MNKINPTILLAGGAALFLFMRSSGQGANPVTALTSLLPGGGGNQAQPQPVNVAITSGVKNSAGNIAGPVGIVNYAALVQTYPGLLNPNYQMTNEESNVYLRNYLDLQQGLATWVNHKINGVLITDMHNACVNHWHTYGCAEQRVFIPLTVASTVPYTPPPSPPKSSGGGLFGSIVKGLTVVAGAAVTVASAGTAAPLISAGTSALLGVEGKAFGGVSESDRLNDMELEMIFQGAAILYEILPMYAQEQPELAQAIQLKLTQILTEYA